MKPIIRWTLWARRGQIIWWSLGIAAFVGLELGVYPSIKGQAPQLNQALGHLPSSLKALLGANADLFSPVGYLSSRLFYLLLPLLLSILAIGWGSSLLAREESDRTLELLLSRPVSRGRVLLAKIFSGLIISGIVSVVATIVCLVLSKVVGLNIPLQNIAMASLMAVLLSLVFGMLAFLIAALGRAGRGAAIGVASLLALGSYVIASLEANVHWLLWPARFLPYHYYNPTAVLNGHYNWGLTAIFAVLILLFGFMAWRSFNERDIA